MNYQYYCGGSYYDYKYSLLQNPILTIKASIVQATSSKGGLRPVVLDLDFGLHRLPWLRGVTLKKS